jgi:predicted amidohydrolase
MPVTESESESAPATVKIAGVQMDPRFGDKAANLSAILAWLNEAADLGAELVVFPECALTGYSFESRAEAYQYAEPIPGDSTLAVAAACARRGVHAISGLREADGDRLYNACVLVGAEGVIGSYRKIHLPFLGVDRFADPGDRPFAVLEAKGLRIGMHICYDGAFPEACRVLTLLGADVLVLPTNWPTQSECAAEHMMATRAMENVVYTIAVNRVGEERGFRFIGRSSIFGTRGERLAFASPDQPEIIMSEIDPAVARTKRLIRVPGKNEVDRIADRRPEFYEAIAAPKDRQHTMEPAHNLPG